MRSEELEVSCGGLISPSLSGTVWGFGIGVIFCLGFSLNRGIVHLSSLLYSQSTSGMRKAGSILIGLRHRFASRGTHERTHAMCNKAGNEDMAITCYHFRNYLRYLYPFLALQFRPH